MIVKRTLSPRRVASYTRGPMLWTTAWATAATLLALAVGPVVAVPFAPVGALGAALAIFVAFRNNVAFARWNEARSAWQAVHVACRSMSRQVVAGTENAVAAGTADEADARHVAEDLVRRLIAYSRALAHQVRPHPDDPPAPAFVDPAEWTAATRSANPAHHLLVDQSRQVKAAIRQGALGQFDPISLEPQLAALAVAQGTLERLATTPTPRQYDVFTRWFVLLYVALLPFGVVSLVPTALGWVLPLSITVGGVFVIMTVVGAVNDEPLAGAVTDVPVHAVCRDIERDLLDVLGADRPPALAPVDGYLW